MLVSQIEDKVQHDIKLALENLKKELKARLAELHRDEKEVLLTDQFNIARIDQTLRTVRQLMDKLGYTNAIRTLVDGMVDLCQEIIEQAGKMDLPAEFSQESKSMIEMLMKGSQDELHVLGDQVASEIGQILRRSAVGGVAFSDLVNQISQRLDTSLIKAMALVRTALASFNSQVRVQTFRDAGIEWFLYAGPEDEVIRDWCQHFVGTRVTPEILEENADRWGREDSGPLRPVVTWRGGYNCRHELIPLLTADLSKYEVGPR